MERHVHAARRDDWLQRPGSVFRGELRDAEGEPADDILVSVHTPAPNAICSTKTIEANAPDCEVRLHLHANPLLVQRCSEWLRTAGFEEFAPPAAAPTGAALWDAQDGLDAEAWARLPQMQTERGARWLLGQAAGLRSTVQCWLAELQQAAARGPDVVAQRRRDNIATSRAVPQSPRATHAVDWFARPLRIALIGPPNAGKSTLANALADRPVSLVSAVPGTTRDWVEAPGEIEGFPVVWVDTAGLRASADPVEVAAGAQTRRVLASTAVVVVVLDGTVYAAAARGHISGAEYAGGTRAALCARLGAPAPGRRGVEQSGSCAGSAGIPGGTTGALARSGCDSVCSGWQWVG